MIITLYLWRIITIYPITFIPVSQPGRLGSISRRGGSLELPDVWTQCCQTHLSFAANEVWEIDLVRLHFSLWKGRIWTQLFLLFESSLLFQCLSLNNRTSLSHSGSKQAFRWWADPLAFLCVYELLVQKLSATF